jgi:hypothetical protein
MAVILYVDARMDSGNIQMSVATRSTYLTPSGTAQASPLERMVLVPTKLYEPVNRAKRPMATASIEYSPSAYRTEFIFQSSYLVSSKGIMVIYQERKICQMLLSARLLACIDMEWPVGPRGHGRIAQQDIYSCKPKWATKHRGGA